MVRPVFPSFLLTMSPQGFHPADRERKERDVTTAKEFVQTYPLQLQTSALGTNCPSLPTLPLDSGKKPAAGLVMTNVLGYQACMKDGLLLEAAHDLI